MLKLCEWRSDKVNCDDLFSNELTDEGLCCSFNRLPADKIFKMSREYVILNKSKYSADDVYNWSLENGFPTPLMGDENKIPRRPLGAGVHLGLTIILDAQIDQYYCSSTRSVGFKVVIIKIVMMDFHV